MSLDPGYLVTHDDPRHADAELAARQAKEATLVGALVWLRDGKGRAVVTRVYAPDLVNVVVLEPLEALTNVAGFAVVPWLPYVCRPVYWRHESGVQFVALVVGVNDGLQHDLLVLSDGYVDLGRGPGVPMLVERVTHGAMRMCWQTEIDA
jgi:hypothetical protein